MGIVNKIRGAIGGSADENDDTYECDTCGAEFELRRTTCENCGGTSISPVE